MVWSDKFRIPGGDTAYDISLTKAAVDLNAIASTTIISVAEAGRLGAIGILVTNLPEGNVTCTLDITIDGGTKRTFSLYNNAIIWSSGDLLAWGSTNTDGGASDFNKIRIPFSFNYATNLLVAVDVTLATGFASDEITVYVIKGKAL